jgi:hypothetical protein
MSDNLSPEIKPFDKKGLVGKGGPIAGSAISIIGNLFVLIGFVLPWASCGSVKLSGLDIVSYSIQGKLGSSSGSFLCLIPFFAIGVIGIALLTIPAALIKKIPTIIKPIGTVLIILMTSLACLPSCLFFFNMQSSRNDPGNYGMGSLIQIEYGFWITMFGLFVSFLGGLIGVGTTIAEISMSRKTQINAFPPDEHL